MNPITQMKVDHIDYKLMTLWLETTSIERDIAILRRKMKSKEQLYREELELAYKVAGIPFTD
jgi:hypothetical protein